MVQEHISPEITLTQDPVTYGLAGKVWEAGSIFAQFLVCFLSNHHLSEIHILELGSGTGVAGISIAKHLEMLQIPWSITLTDKLSVLPLLQQNIKANFTNDANIKCQELVWGSNPKNWNIEVSKFNIVFGSDIVYDDNCFDALNDTLNHIIDENTDAYLFLAYVRRRRAERRFWNMIKKRFLVQAINDPNRNLYCNSKLNIVRLVKKN